METTGVAADDYAVFELVNSRLKEIYVGVASGAALRTIPLRLPPRESIAHWGLSEPDLVRPIELDLTEIDARRFAALYVKTELPDGWRFLT